jgi:hypothetical protein
MAAAEPQEGTLELGASVVGVGVSEVECAEFGFADRPANGRGRDAALQSAMVRAGVVTGIPLRAVVSYVGSEERWIRRPRRLRRPPLRPGR